jgi:hypothetical protein
VALVLLIYFVSQDYAKGGDPYFWRVAAVLVGLVLNLVYLLAHQSFPSKSRIARIINLWLDTIENELRRRAKEH